jgi:hypothetical protein
MLNPARGENAMSMESFRTASLGLAYSLALITLVALAQLTEAEEYALWIHGARVDPWAYHVANVEKAFVAFQAQIAAAAVVHWIVVALAGRGDVLRVSRVANALLVYAGAMYAACTYLLQTTPSNYLRVMRIF